MDNLADLATFTIAFCAVFTALGFMFNILLKPVKDNQARMELEQKNIKDMLLKEQEKVNNAVHFFESSVEKINLNIEHIMKKLNTREDLKRPEMKNDL